MLEPEDDEAVDVVEVEVDGWEEVVEEDDATDEDVELEVELGATDEALVDELVLEEVDPGVLLWVLVEEPAMLEVVAVPPIDDAGKPGVGPPAGKW